MLVLCLRYRDIMHFVTNYGFIFPRYKKSRVLNAVAFCDDKIYR